MNNKELNLINKVYVSRKQKSKRRTIFKISTSICLLFILISLIVGNGINASLAPVSLLLAVSLGGLATNKESGIYKTCPCKIVFNDKIYISNQDLDREDSLGVRNEHISFEYKDIDEIQYSAELNSVRICGKGSKTIEWISRQNREPKITLAKVAYIYLNDFNKSEIIEAFEDCCNIRINYVN